MAEWCKQCSDEMFGEDHKDYKTYDKPAPRGHVYMVLCEGCGIVCVNQAGECIDEDCEKHNGAVTAGVPA